MKKTLITLSILILAGCAQMPHDLTNAAPVRTEISTNVKKEFDTIPEPAAGRPLSVAVYSFADKTGQRKPSQNLANLSTAVTQGGETLLIEALQNVGKGRWFEVVERVGIDNLTKERLIIRQMREAYEGAQAKPLAPMMFAGVILEGAIVGYDSSVNSGGNGARIFGIGAQEQWTQDTVTVSLRAVSVNTGKILVSVTVQKTILSTSNGLTTLKFFDAGTKSFEGETGTAVNEPGTYAVKSAIEMAVVEMIKEGERKGHWEFKKEEKKDELVQQKTAPQDSPKNETTQSKSSSGPTVGRDENQAQGTGTTK